MKSFFIMCRECTALYTLCERARGKFYVKKSVADERDGKNNREEKNRKKQIFRHFLEENSC